MTRLTQVKVTVALLAVVIWFAGVRLEDRRLTWAGMGLLVGAFLLRFLNRRDQL